MAEGDARAMSDSSEVRAPESQVGFSSVHEDPSVEIAVAERVADRLGRPVRVLAVGSGGCTALSLLTSPKVASVTAVDLNAAQLHLIALKRAAVDHLSLDEQHALLGDTEGPQARRAAYAKVRDELDDATRAYWDAHDDEVAFGVGRIGRLEGLFREVREAFAERGIDPLREPARALGCSDWPRIFQTAFEKARLAQSFGSASVGYSGVRCFAQHYSRRFADALRRFAASRTDNYFLLNVFRGHYEPERGAVPPWLTDEGQRQIREGGAERLRLLPGNFHGRMVQLAKEQPFDLIQTSDLTDWLPVPQVHELYKAARQSTAPGGAILSRRLNGDHHLAGLVGRHFDVDAAFSADLFGEDRSFVYSELVVGYAGDAPTA